MVIFGGKTCVITEVAKDVPWVFFQGTSHAITLLVDLFIMEGSDSYGILMGQKLIMHPALSAVLQGFLSALCVFPELATKEMEAVRAQGQAGWGQMYEIPVQTFKQYPACSVQMLSDSEYKGMKEAELMKAGDVESNPRPHIPKGAYIGQAEARLILSGDVETNPGPISHGNHVPPLSPDFSVTMYSLQVADKSEVQPHPWYPGVGRHQHMCRYEHAIENQRQFTATERLDFQLPN